MVALVEALAQQEERYKEKKLCKIHLFNLCTLEQQFNCSFLSRFISHTIIKGATMQDNFLFSATKNKHNDPKYKKVDFRNLRSVL